MRRSSLFAVLTGVVMLLAVLWLPGHVAAQATTQDVQITVSEFQFGPNTFNVVAGQKIHFSVQNSGKFPHNISFKQGDTTLTVFANPIAGGQTGEADFVFPTAGTWDMYCPVGNHAERGMVGTVQALTTSNVGMPQTGQGQDQNLLLTLALCAALVAGGLFMRRVWAKDETA